MWRHVVGSLIGPWLQQDKRAGQTLEPLPSPKKNDRIMFFAPHPDDEVCAAGAYLAAAAKVGASAMVVLVTDANSRGYGETRRQEFEQVLIKLGVTEKRYFNFAEGELSNSSAELKTACEEIIDEYRPTVVIIPHPEDLHSDHAAVGEVVSHITHQTSIMTLAFPDHFPPQYPSPRGYRPDLYLLPPSSIANRYHWTSFSVSPELQRLKTEAMKEYRLELRTPVLRSHMLSSIRKNELFAKL